MPRPPPIRQAVGGAANALVASFNNQRISAGAAGSRRGGTLHSIVAVQLFLVLHLFGIIFWVGSLLLITTILGKVADEVGVAKERFIIVASDLFYGGCNIGGAVTLVFGILLMVAEPDLLKQGWLHAKLGLVFVLILVHLRLYRRIVALTDNPSSVSRSEFRAIHGVVSLLLLAILALVFFRGF
jgi:protoporphyrinogen IX oxidase